MTNVEHHLARCLVKTAASLGYTLEPGHDVAWPFTASRHPVRLAEMIDAGAAHAAAQYAHGLLTLTVELLGDQATGDDGSDPAWAAAQAARLAVADQRRRWARQRLRAQTGRYRRALERLVAARTGLVRHRQGVPTFLPPPPGPAPEVDPPGGPMRLETGTLAATVVTGPDGTTRIHARVPGGTDWQVTFSPGTPQQVIDAARGARGQRWVATPDRPATCGATYVTGGHDPYGTEYDLAFAHTGPHRGVDPFGGDGHVQWSGGGSAGGDPLPFRDVRWTR